MREPHPGAEFCAALAFLFLLGIGAIALVMQIVETLKGLMPW